MSLSRVGRGKGVECVCKGVFRMIDFGIEVEYGVKWGYYGDEGLKRWMI